MTAIQEFIEWLNENKGDINGGGCYGEIFAKMTELLKKERQQIIGSYIESGMKNHNLPYGMAYLAKLNSVEQDAEDYYNQTYNQ